MKYDHKKIEKKWQKQWEEDGIYNTDDNSKKPKWYSLIEFPYPSGDGLHVGHILSNTAMDIVSRKRRMEGYNVLYPMGWDAFGLPTENHAIKTGISPQEATKKNTDTFRRQLKSLGFSFDWSREINTTDPEYYKWTQWLFLKFFEKGLAYKDKMPINWCLSCKIGLANEEVVAGVCERCGGQVEKRDKEQWMLKITAYADKLLQGLEEVDFLPEIKAQQRNWIGRSEGAEIDFQIKDSAEKIKVFTTRPDTILGATYMVLSPEHSLIQELDFENKDEVEKYIEEAKKKSDLERKSDDKEKTGVEFKGVKAINPGNKEEIPVWVADYVMTSYGTGAIMAVPQHDERDREFAEKFNLKIANEPLLNFNKSIKMVQGKRAIQYKLRDWVFSRQRYWGEPIPIIKCERCGYIPVPEKDLPVELPKVDNYQPRDDGQSPLASVEEWVNVQCPKCKGEAKRETDTMPNWAGSSWYFLRYVDPHNDKEFANKKMLKKMMPVDWYNGGMEHVTLHLLYSRFWNQFLYDIKLVPTKEPYKKRTAHGMILAADGKKMSKSLGNVINPDELIEEFGADSLRLYEMFIGPFDQVKAWDPRGILGPNRFLEKVWRVNEKVGDFEIDKDLEKVLHQTIKKVTNDIESMNFNTAISKMMVFVNACAEKENISKDIWERFLLILSPFAPHITEELYQGKDSIHIQSWPKYNEKLAKEETFELVVQINGKVRDRVGAEIGISEAQAKEIILQRKETQKWVGDREIKKVIYVQDRLVNLII